MKRRDNVVVVHFQVLLACEPAEISKSGVKSTARPQTRLGIGYTTCCVVAGVLGDPGSRFEGQISGFVGEDDAMTEASGGLIELWERGGRGSRRRQDTSVNSSQPTTHCPKLVTRTLSLFP